VKKHLKSEASLLSFALAMPGPSITTTTAGADMHGPRPAWCPTTDAVVAQDRTSGNHHHRGRWRM
jgi:hypothetical protein